MSIENEHKEEFNKIAKMNSREKLVHLREFVKFYIEVKDYITSEDIDHIIERVMLITKGCDGDGVPALV